MQRIALLTIAAVLIACSSVHAAEFKLGIVDVQEVLKKSEAGQAAMKEMKDKFNDMREDLEKRKAEIENLRKEMEKQNLVLSLEAKQDKELELKRKARDFQDQVQIFQRRMQSEQDKATKPIVESLGNILKDYGKKHGYTMILEKRAPGLYYADDAAEITNEVLVELNKQLRAK